ncbi:MAG TPA: ABC transporter substrate-binding protein [Gemmatimonadales bacterium]|nr:ABC transporter substrate-binding protein [Gemmatimonadales bacterium]
MAERREGGMAGGREPKLIALIGLLLASWSCEAGPYQRQAPDAPVIRIGAPTRLTGLDPTFSWDYYKALPVTYVFEGLSRAGDGGAIEPALAREWQVSPDSRTWRFTLRAGVRFHDGTPFRAADVIRSWTTALRVEEGELAHPWMLDPIEGAVVFSAGRGNGAVPGLEAPDDTTLIVRLREPLAFFPTLLSLPQSFITAPASDSANPIGTGPWRWVGGSGDEVRLVRNDAYWSRAPLLDSLLYRYVPDSLVARAFSEGWVDMASELPAALRQEWSVRSDIGFVESEALNATRLIINFREPVFHDVRVRRALNHAIAAARLATTTGAASAVRAAGAIPPSLPGSSPDRAPYAFDPPRARSLLREGGYPFERPFRLRVPAPGLSDYPGEIGALLRDYLEAVGLTVELTVQNEGIEAAMAEREADAILSIWVGDYPDGDAFLYPLYHSRSAGNAGNEGFYANPALDRLIDASRREPDPARRMALLKAADQLVFDDAPVVFLWFTRTTTAYSLRLEGWARDPQTSRFLELRLAGAVERANP